jgi:hypothetical protein
MGNSPGTQPQIVGRGAFPVVQFRLTRHLRAMHRPSSSIHPSFRIFVMYMCIANVALGSKVAGYHDPRVLSEHCLDVPLTALPPITYVSLRWPTDRPEYFGEGTRLQPYPKRSRLLTPMDLTKFVYVILC